MSNDKLAAALHGDPTSALVRVVYPNLPAQLREDSPVGAALREWLGLRWHSEGDDECADGRWLEGEWEPRP